MEICGIKGCEDPVRALGMCNKHWQRTRLYGSPFSVKSHAGAMKGLPAEARFNLQHKKGAEGECWEWIACVDKDGYGRFEGNVGETRYTKAHRFSWALHSQSVIPPGMMVCHSCDNPRCVNPAHLWLGSCADNLKDMSRKGRKHRARGELSGTAKLDEVKVRKILADPSPHAMLAQKYGVTSMTISDIKCRRSWGHLEIDHVARAVRVSGKRGKSDRLTADMVRAIRESREMGKTLAIQYNVSPQMICAIRKRRVWAHIN
jgi:hypothetical protein